MWRYWNPYYHPDPPKWLFLIIFWGPLLSLFLLGYFVMAFRVIEQVPVPIAVNDSMANVTDIIMDPDYNSTNYDETYEILKKHEIEIGYLTHKHYKGYGTNAYLTANIFFGGAEFNKTGGTGILAFLLAATCFLVIFIVTYLVYDLLYPKLQKPDISRLFYPGTQISANEEEELYMAALSLEKARKSGVNPKITQKIGWLFEDIDYRPDLIINSILYIACLLVSVAYAEPNNISPILELARRSWGIDLKLELVYTVGSWVYSIAVTAFALSFHGSTLLAAKFLHWLVFE